MSLGCFPVRYSCGGVSLWRIPVCSVVFPMGRLCVFYCLVTVVCPPSVLTSSLPGSSGLSGVGCALSLRGLPSDCRKVGGPKTGGSLSATEGIVSGVPAPRVFPLSLCCFPWWLVSLVAVFPGGWCCRRSVPPLVWGSWSSWLACRATGRRWGDGRSPASLGRAADLHSESQSLTLPLL